MEVQVLLGEGKGALGGVYGGVLGRLSRRVSLSLLPPCWLLKRGFGDLCWGAETSGLNGANWCRERGDLYRTQKAF